MTPKAIRTDAHQLTDRGLSRPAAKPRPARPFCAPEDLSDTDVSGWWVLMGELTAHHSQPPFRLHAGHRRLYALAPAAGTALAPLPGYLAPLPRPTRGAP